MHTYSFEKLEAWKESIKLAIISKELQFISEENYKNIRFEVESITNKINALRNHFINS
ncbi:MAG: archaellum component FlaC [Glaciecola sp.]|jgi:archaellum component FlaC